MSDEVDKMIEDLILNGSLEVSAIDMETGEPLYTFTEKLKDVNPVLHEEALNFFSREALKLWESGFLDMDVTQKNPTVKLTEKALNEEEILKLDKDKQSTLRQIKKYMLEE